MKFIKYMLTEQKVLIGVILAIVFLYIFAITGEIIFMWICLFIFMVPVLYEIIRESPKIIKRDYEEWKKREKNREKK